ncbi:hypothetical protein R1sor_023047 [Riccia sorocarpa]|uniref:Uncharacterized protein n=1 Tax=Riccia sorocarpa TaxID=122646 RepID=A0ABD3GN43_9MARC
MPGTRFVFTRIGTRPHQAEGVATAQDASHTSRQKKGRRRWASGKHKWRRTGLEWDEDDGGKQAEWSEPKETYSSSAVVMMPPLVATVQLRLGTGDRRTASERRQHLIGVRGSSLP